MSYMTVKIMSLIVFTSPFIIFTNRFLATNFLKSVSILNVPKSAFLNYSKILPPRCLNDCKGDCRALRREAFAFNRILLRDRRSINFSAPPHQLFRFHRHTPPPNSDLFALKIAHTQKKT